MVLRSVILCAVSALTGMLYGQDPMMRMDPDAWCQTEEVQQAIGMLDDYAEAYQAFFKFDSGALLQVANGYGQWTRRADDMRVVLDSNGVNVSRSHNHGFNLGAYHFTWKNRLHSLGGIGFWNSHGLLVDFVPQTGEWELLPSQNAPDYVQGGATWLDEDRGVVMAIELSRVLENKREAGRPVRGLNLQTREWTPVGVVNPKLNVHFEDAGIATVELEDYVVWLAQHKMIALRKDDRQVVVTDLYNRKMWLKGMANRETGGVLVTGAKGGEIFVDHISAEGEFENRLTWDVATMYEVNREQAFDFLVAGVPIADQVAGEVATGGTPVWPFAMLALAVPLAFAWGRSSGPKRLVKNDEESPEQWRPDEAAGQKGLSLLVRNLLALDVREMDTAALNAFLGLEGDLSEETRRARRAQAVRHVNQEYRLYCGQDLIQRMKDPNDRRRTTYFIRPD